MLSDIEVFGLLFSCLVVLCLIVSVLCSHLSFMFADHVMKSASTIQSTSFPTSTLQIFQNPPNKHKYRLGS